MLRNLLVMVAIGSSLSHLHQDWDAADRRTTRLAPAAFVDLPAPVRTELEARGCTIPQPFAGNGSQNVVKGRFTSAKQMDWAVLCSRQGTSSILVFRGGAASTVAEIAAQADVNSLQTIDGSGTIGYSRTITVATSRFIQDQHKAYGGPKPPPLDHEGISDVFIEKGSIVWYWYRNAWLMLQGSN
jgi:hypothetical protein